MTKFNERTFGSRLQNAKKLAAAIKSFNDYKPPRSTDTVDNFNLLIEAINAANENASTVTQELSAAINEKNKLFYKNENSLKKLVTPINRAVKSQYGFDSKAAQDIRSKVIKLRSSSLRGAANKTEVQTTAATTNQKSRSQLSFGSVVENFKDLYLTLGKLSPEYDPPNTAITLPNLEQIYTQLIGINESLSIVDIKHTIALSAKYKLYDDLSDRVKHIKESIRCQYSTKSDEYVIIKNL